MRGRGFFMACYLLFFLKRLYKVLTFHFNRSIKHLKILLQRLKTALFVLFY